jgi:hypothetical protein
MQFFLSYHLLSFLKIQLKQTVTRYRQKTSHMAHEGADKIITRDF